MDAGASERLYEQGLSAKDAKKIFELGLCYDITMGIWARNRLYGNKLDERMRAYQMISGVEPVRIDAFEDLPAKDVTKIVWCGDPGCLKKITEELSGDLFAEVTCCLSQPSILEFFSSRVSKALAMQKIGERYGSAGRRCWRWETVLMMWRCCSMPGWGLPWIMRRMK